MDNKNNPYNNNNDNQPRMPKFNMSWIYAIVAITLAIFSITGGGNSLGNASADKKVTCSKFKQYVTKGYAENTIINKEQNILRMYVKPEYIRDIFNMTAKQTGTSPYVGVEFGLVDELEKYLTAEQSSGKTTNFSYENEKGNGLMNILLDLSFPIFLIVIWIFLIRRMGGGGAGGSDSVFNVGKNRAKIYGKGSDLDITFKGVAGRAGAKQKVREIVDFLKNPQKYTNLDGKIPKGTLLVGPPGTGKTLLVKVVTGGAGVLFFSMSGFDFIEMFVGVGASRVHGLFRQAKEKSPCVIFISEINAVGRARSKNPAMGGNDEGESTLNTLLAEMDGFGTNGGVTILAAISRAGVLDNALLHTGHFDRQISVDLPDLPERKGIFLVHLHRVKVTPDLNIGFLSRQAPGFSSADIANIYNETALIATRHNKTQVGKQGFLDTVDHIIGGLEEKTKVMTAGEERTIVLHEAGHATVSWFYKRAHPLVEVPIVPRGRVLGAAQYLSEERQITTKEQMLDKMYTLSGGRIAEELCVGQASTGVINGLERTTKSSYSTIAYAGTSDVLPNICYYNNQEYQFQKPYSETTAKIIDDEVLKMINEQYDRARQLLTGHKEGHAKLAELLLTREVIFVESVEEIFGKRPWVSRSQETMQDNEPKLEDIPEKVKVAKEKHQRTLKENKRES